MAAASDYIAKKLEKFAEEEGYESVGPLAMALVVTDTAKGKSFPLVEKDFLTPQGGSVSRLSGKTATKIADRCGVKTAFGTESGRTSRGMPEKMRTYVRFLNDLSSHRDFDLESILDWWAHRTETFFHSRPLSVNLDASVSIQTIVRMLLDKAVERQKRAAGTTYIGTVLQHLVGAKLETLPTIDRVEHHGASTADQQTSRAGDFLIGDTVIHVTTSPTDTLIKKCRDNLSAALRPIIVTTLDGARGAENAAKMEGIEDRIEIIEISQFISTNIYERSGFRSNTRKEETENLIHCYNSLIEKYENNPSLKINLD